PLAPPGLAGSGQPSGQPPRVAADCGGRPQQRRWQGVTTMRKSKKERLEAAGWKVGDARDFLGLTREEAEFIDLKLALAGHLREVRVKHGWTQAHVAQLLGSSQSRLAKMEAGDASVSLDLLVRSLLALGISRK